MLFSLAVYQLFSDLCIQNRWDEAEVFILADDPYVGQDSIFEGRFARLGAP